MKSNWIPVTDRMPKNGQRWITDNPLWSERCVFPAAYAVNPGIPVGERHLPDGGLETSGELAARRSETEADGGTR